ncbi:MAG: hypothetical protein SNJ54_16005, partial [Anaerolineae bacterium]
MTTLRGRALIGVLGMLALVPLASAQQGRRDCPVIVREALQVVNEACQTVGRNSACYGHLRVEVSSRGDQALRFNQTGDTVSVFDVAGLTLSPLDEATGAWGVAVMRLQANLPESTPGENVTVLMFGDAQVQAAVDDRLSRDDSIPEDNVLSLGRTASGVITNQAPSVSFRIQLRAGDVIDVLMRRTGGDLDTYISLRDPNGVEIASNDDDRELGTSGSRLSNVPVPVGGFYTLYATRYREQSGNSTGTFDLTVTPSSMGYAQPMQAFYFQSGVGAPSCAEAPNGMLIQSPRGAVEVRLLINEVRFDLGSTAFLQADPSGFMTIAMLEGIGRVESFGVARIVPAGAFVRVPLDAQSSASGSPTEPEPYTPNIADGLPLALLEREITPAPPISAAALRRGDLTITLEWDNDADMDLQLFEPDGAHVYFGNPSSISGARLDVDANAACDRNFGRRETITWPSGQPRLGTHRIVVSEYAVCNQGRANWTLEVRIGAEVILRETGT